MKAIWQMYHAELSEQQVNNIIKECEYYHPVKAEVGLGKDGAKKDNVRKSEVRWIDVNDVNSKFIMDILYFYTNLANRVAFGVDTKKIWDVQYTKYKGKEKGFYDWHFDTFWGNDSLSDRKLSVTIQLSDSDDYEGGDFIIDPQYEAPNKKDLRKKGTILVFPSVIRHKVEPVTKGERKSLVAWVEGDKWK